MAINRPPTIGLVACVYALLVCLVLAPLWLVGTPSLGDYLNHLARMHVLAQAGHSAALARYYQVRWAPIPYLAMDAIVPLLSRMVPIYVAGKLFLSACVLLPPAAVAVLHRTVHRRNSLVPCAAFLLSYNGLLSLGFLNFLFSSALAVMLFALWLRVAGWPPLLRVAGFAPLVLLLYLGHVFACLAYCLAVAGHELAEASRAGWRPLPRVAVNFAAAAGQAVPAAIFAARLDVGAGYVGPLHTVFGGVPEKLYAFASPLLFVPDGPDAACAAGALLLAAVLLRRVRLDAAVWPACALVGFAGLAVPHLLASTWGTDLRLPFVAAMLGLGGLSPRQGRVSPAVAGLAAAVTCLLVGIKSADAWRMMRQSSALVAETRAVLAGLPEGARLLVVNVARGIAGQGGPPPASLGPSSVWQLPMVAVIEHDAFVPYFFSGLATVHITSAWRAASTPNGFPVTLDQLRQGVQATDIPGHDLPDGPGGARLYQLGWPAKFTHVLVQHYGLDAGPLPGNLMACAHTAGLDLYRVTTRPPTIGTESLQLPPCSSI